MLSEFMNLLRKFYFMRAAARSVKIKIILFDRLKEPVLRQVLFLCVKTGLTYYPDKFLLSRAADTPVLSYNAAKTRGSARFPVPCLQS